MPTGGLLGFELAGGGRGVDYQRARGGGGAGEERRGDGMG